MRISHRQFLAGVGAGVAELLLVRRRAATDDVANTGKEVSEDVGPEDRVTTYNAEMLHDPVAGDCRGCDYQYEAS
jgi:hypothetical protein